MKKGKASYKERPESPTAIVAKALMIMNKDTNEQAFEVSFTSRLSDRRRVNTRKVSFLNGTNVPGNK